MKRIRLELARDHDYPAGSQHHGYEFTAPLDVEGLIIAEEWRRDRDACRVKQFWQGEPDEIDHLVHRPGGSWAFHYDIHGDEDDDEAGYRFQNHKFNVGEYVSIRERNEEERTFRVVSADPSKNGGITRPMSTPLPFQRPLNSKALPQMIFHKMSN